MSDDERSRDTAGPLEARLAALGREIAWPAAPDIARSVGQRLRTTRDRGGWWASLRPVRRAALAAAALVLLLAAAVAALSVLVPGLRIVVVPPGTTLPPTASAVASPGSPRSLLGATLGLGSAVDLAEAGRIGGFEPILPGDATLGPPDEAYVAQRRVNLLWRASPGLPGTRAPGVGLVVTEFRGLIDDGWYEKIVLEGSTTVEEVRIGGDRGWWVSGDPHQLVYRDAGGRALEETRRVVGDVLIWRRDGITLRIESALGRDATIRLAETFAPAR